MKQERKRELLLKEYLVGETSVRKLAKRYGMSVTTVQRRLVAAKKDNSTKPAATTQKLAKPGREMPVDVKALQEELYNAQLKISLLEAMIDISDEQYGTDIRKKAGTRQS